MTVLEYRCCDRCDIYWGITKGLLEEELSHQKGAPHTCPKCQIDGFMTSNMSDIGHAVYLEQTGKNSSDYEYWGEV